MGLIRRNGEMTILEILDETTKNQIYRLVNQPEMYVEDKIHVV